MNYNPPQVLKSESGIIPHGPRRTYYVVIGIPNRRYLVCYDSPDLEPTVVCDCPSQGAAEEVCYDLNAGLDPVNAAPSVVYDLRGQGKLF